MLEDTAFCVLFHSEHTPDEREKTCQLIRSLQKELPNVFLLYDNRSLSSSPLDIPTWSYTPETLNRNGLLTSFPNETPIRPGYNDVPLLEFAHQVKFTHYWRIEYDVHFTGSWRELFSYYNDSDFVGYELKPVTDEWYWSYSLSLPDYLVPYCSLLCLSKFSSYLAERLRKVRMTQHGHFEAVVPSYVMSDPSLKVAWYKDVWANKESFSCTSDAITLPLSTPNTLFHPIKKPQTSFEA